MTGIDKNKVNVDVHSVPQINVITDHTDGNNFVVCVCLCVLNCEQSIQHDPIESNCIVV